MKETNLNYEDLFGHVANLRKVLLVATGRAGTDFFQSLLDGHSQILQVTGSWFSHLWWKIARCKENLPDLINEFVWYSDLVSNHIAKFKSYYNKLERWDQLGSDKNEFFEVSIDAFTNHMINILSGKELNSKNFFLAVNLAYGLSTNVDIKNTKILFYHIHHKEKLKEFKDDFSEFDVICTIREPRNTLVSGIEHWKRFDAGTYTSRHFYELLKRIFDESEPILQFTNNIKTLKLEDTHLSAKEVMREFCDIYGLELQDTMFESSYHGKKWWGDALSGKYLDGFNPNIKDKRWQGKLYFYDNFLIEFILENRLKHYGYSCEIRMRTVYWIFVPFLVFLPMKYELKILIDNLKIKRYAKGKMSALGIFLIFYIFRVCLYFKFIWGKITKKIFLADFFNKGALEIARQPVLQEKIA